MKGIMFIINYIKGLFNWEKKKEETSTGVPWNGRYILLSAGHGGIDPDTGRYVTSPESHGTDGDRVGTKCCRHEGQGELHGDGWLYEGVTNREYADQIREIAEPRGYKVIDLHHT